MRHDDSSSTQLRPMRGPRVGGDLAAPARLGGQCPCRRLGYEVRRTGLVVGGQQSRAPCRPASSAECQRDTTVGPRQPARRRRAGPDRVRGDSVLRRQEPGREEPHAQGGRERRHRRLVGRPARLPDGLVVGAGARGEVGGGAGRQPQLVCQRHAIGRRHELDVRRGHVADRRVARHLPRAGPGSEHEGRVRHSRSCSMRRTMHRSRPQRGARHRRRHQLRRTSAPPQAAQRIPHPADRLVAASIRPRP